MLSNFAYTVLTLSIGVAFGWVSGVLSKTIYFQAHTLKLLDELQEGYARAKELSQIADAYAAGVDIETIKSQMSPAMRAEFEIHRKDSNAKL